MTLHEAIQKVLEDANQPLTAKEIARIINEKNLYFKGDNNPVLSNQIYARINHHRDIFYNESGKIGLLKFNDDKTLDFLIETVLQEKNEPLTTAEILTQIQNRSEASHLKKSTLTQGNIFLRCRAQKRKYRLDGDLVSLIEWDENLNVPTILRVSSPSNIENEVFEESIPKESLSAKSFEANTPYLKVESEKNKVIYHLRSEKIELNNRNLKEISLSNFKAFSTSQNLPVKPITIIFGANSSGKSSILHSLLYLYNAITTNNLDPYLMSISGNSVDLGGFRQIVYKHEPTNRITFTLTLDHRASEPRLRELIRWGEKIIIEFEIGQAIEEIKESVIVGEDEKKIYFDQRPTGELRSVGKPKIYRYEVKTDDELLFRMSLRGDVFKIDQLNFLNENIVNLREVLIISNSTMETGDDVVWQTCSNTIEDEIIPNGFSEKTDLFPKSFRLNKSDSTSEMDLLVPISKGNKVDDIKKITTLYFPYNFSEILKGLDEIISKSLSDLVYLGPLRSNPPRHLIGYYQQNDQNWTAGGGYAWERLGESDTLREKVNTWLSSSEKLQTKYKLVVRKHLDIEGRAFNSIIRNASKEVEFQLDKLNTFNGADGIVEEIRIKIEEYKDVEGINELLLYDERNKTIVSHRDVGIGISQVLPVLVYAFGNREKKIAIEQPEIHLHPAMQAELGDVFIETSAKNNNANTYFLETHSEHLILRILRRIRETTLNKKNNFPITKDDIALLFVESTDKGSKIHNLRVDDMGKIIDPVPGGFFEEDFEELF